MGLFDNQFFHRIWRNGVKVVDSPQAIEFKGDGVDVSTIDGRTVVDLSAVAPGGGSAAAIDPVRVVSTTNIALTGFPTISGVVVAPGNRVGVLGQLDAAQNGIYTVPASGAWPRSSDLDTAAKIEASIGVFVLINEGPPWANSAFILKTPAGPITVGVTQLQYALGLAPPNPVTDLGKFPRVNASGQYDFVAFAGAITVSLLGTVNYDLSGSETLDGTATTNGELVLLTGQTTLSQNGVWKVNHSGAWTRPNDVVHAPGLVVNVSGGGFGRGVWQLDAAIPFTTDTTAQTWRRVSGTEAFSPTPVSTSTTSATTIRAINLPRGRRWHLEVTVCPRRTDAPGGDEFVCDYLTYQIQGSTTADGSSTTLSNVRLLPGVSTANGVGTASFSVTSGILDVRGFAGDALPTEWPVTYRWLRW